MWKSEMEAVFSTRMNKNLNKCDVLLLTAIETVTVTKCYVFRDFKVTTYRKKCLNSMFLIVSISASKRAVCVTLFKVEGGVSD